MLNTKQKYERGYFLMKISNSYLLKKLVSYGVYKTEPLNHISDIEHTHIIADETGNKLKVITKDISDDEINLILEIKKIEALNSIKTMLKFFVILTIIGLIILFCFILSNLSS